MPEENPEMTYPTPAPKKPRRAPAKRRAPVRKSVAPKAAEPVSDPRVNEYLTNIYRDKNGSIPDMRHIAVKRGGSWLRSLTTFIVSIAILVGIGWYGYFWYTGKSKATPNGATISIDGPTSVTLGATTTYMVTVQNTSDISISKATLQMFYPAGFLYVGSDKPSSNSGHNEWDVGRIDPHTKKTITISGQNFGAVSTKGSWRAFLSYQPDNFNSTLQQSAFLDMSINTSPFELSISGPATIIAGNEFTLQYTLKSSGSWHPAKLYLSPTVPTNFSISTSSPILDKSNRWVITPGTSTQNVAGTTQTFTLRGTLSQSVDTAQMFSAALTLPQSSTGNLYEVATASINPAIAKNGVAFNIAVNGAVNDSYTKPGDTLAITIQTKNTGLSDAKKAVVKLTLDAPSVKNQSMLQWSNLDDKNNATVQGQQVSPTIRRGIATWTSSEIPALAKLKPNDQVQIDLALPVKDGSQFDLALLSPSSTIKIQSEIDYVDASGTAKVITGNPITLSFGTDTNLAVHDTADGSKHAITWVLSNTLHTIKDILITAPVFGNVAYSSSSTPDGGTLSYDSAAKTVNWRIEAMPDSVDVLTAPFMLNITKVDKSQNILVGKPHLTATDAVTGQPIDITADQISL